MILSNYRAWDLELYTFDKRLSKLASFYAKYTAFKHGRNCMQQESREFWSGANTTGTMLLIRLWVTKGFVKLSN